MAARAVHAIADGRDEEALAVLRDGTHAETTWAAGYMLAALRECTSARFEKKPVRVALALHRAADGIGSDVFATRLALLAQDGDQDD